MPSKAEVGRRVKLARFRRDMTLKEVAVRSGMSATHISEIERGKTSPTIGALDRIATALGERSAHFVEESSTAEAVLTRRADRVREYTCDRDQHVTESESLTQAAPWSTTRVFRESMAPGESVARHPALGEVVVMCTRGMIRLTLGDSSTVLRDGDTIQFALDTGYQIENAGDEVAESLSIASLVTPRAW